MQYISEIARFMGPTWGPPGSWRPQMGPMLTPWTLLSGMFSVFASTKASLIICFGYMHAYTLELVCVITYNSCTKSVKMTVTKTYDRTSFSAVKYMPHCDSEGEGQANHRSAISSSTNTRDPMAIKLVSIEKGIACLYIIFTLYSRATVISPIHKKLN